MQTDLIAIRRGLLGPELDRAFWRSKAVGRLRFLEEDRTDFGLTQAEETEIAELKKLLAAGDAVQAPQEI